MLSHKNLRSFSEKKHKVGKWRTRILHSNTPLLRYLWSLLSLKRQSVDNLITNINDNSIGIDLGCGTGAYTHWILEKQSCTIVAVDWSITALAYIPPNKHGKILKVCADTRYLPFKNSSFDFFFSVDTLGHVIETDIVLDELHRITKENSHFFIHSESSDYKYRWPDKKLIKKLGYDKIAQKDQHVGIIKSKELYIKLSKRFQIDKFFSPAGITGWLTGHPEEYKPIFREVHWYHFYIITLLFAILKKFPITGIFLRLINNMINKLEILLKVTGGGSSFAFGRKLSHKN